MKAKTVAAASLADMKNFIAKRPVYSVLSSEKYSSELAGRRPGPGATRWRNTCAITCDEASAAM